MEAAENKYIAAAYRLYTTEDGKRDLVGKTTVEYPFQFISGLSAALEAFESQIANLNKGDRFGFTIPFIEAYGEYDEEHVVDLPRSIPEIDGRFDSEHIYPGNIIPLMNSEGQCPSGSVAEVRAGTVVMDMNHPLVDGDLISADEVAESCPATNEEIQEMARMMTGEGGCSCGSCSGGCSDDYGDSCGDSCGYEHCH